MPNYLEHDKLHTIVIAEQRQAISTFLNWLQESYVIAEHDEYNELQSTHTSIEALLAAYFEKEPMTIRKLAPVPVGISAAISTGRPELARVVSAEVRQGSIELIVPEQAAIIDLLGDFIGNNAANRQRLRSMLTTIRDIQTSSTGLAKAAEKLLILVEGCGVDA